MAALSPPSPACLTHRALAAEHVDVHANAFNPVNYGTTSSPIGGLDLQVTMSSHGYFKKTTVGCHIVYACAASRARVLVAAASRRCRAVAHTRLRRLSSAAPAATAAARLSPATRTNHLPFEARPTL